MVRYCCAELISIHAPRTGSDCKSRSKRLSKRTFQSTLPARGATDPLTNVAISCGSISIHAPRTGSDRNTSHTISTQEHFNPRSPHGERLKYQRDVNIVIKFQSTLPARGATKARAQRWNRLVISIHAPRTGSDPSSATAAASACDFNPRSPHGERRIHTSAHLQANSKFQSTLPARGATSERLRHHGNQGISIHAPRTGSDLSRQDNRREDEAFQSTLPARGATEGVQDA